MYGFWNLTYLRFLDGSNHLEQTDDGTFSASTYLISSTTSKAGGTLPWSLLFLYIFFCI